MFNNIFPKLRSLISRSVEAKAVHSDLTDVKSKIPDILPDVFKKLSPEEMAIEITRKFIKDGNKSLVGKITAWNVEVVQRMIQHKLPVSGIEEIISKDDDSVRIVRQMFRAIDKSKPGSGTGDITCDKINKLLAARNDHNWYSIMSLLNARDAEAKTLFSFEDVTKIAEEVDSFQKAKELRKILPHDGEDASKYTVEQILAEL